MQGPTFYVGLLIYFSDLVSYRPIFLNEFAYLY